MQEQQIRSSDLAQLNSAAQLDKKIYSAEACIPLLRRLQPR